MAAPKNPNGGRPAIAIPLDELGKLCERQCSDEEIAAYFGVTERTIIKRKKSKEFLAVMEKGKARGRVRLRSELFSRALNDKNSAAYLIFACKTILGLRERAEFEHSTKAGQPLQIETKTNSEDLVLINEFMKMAAVAKSTIDESPGTSESVSEPSTA